MHRSLQRSLLIPLGFVPLGIGLTVLSGCAHAPAGSRSTAQAPEVQMQQTLERGTQAIQRQDWEAAVRYFAEAEEMSWSSPYILLPAASRIEPTAPHLLFNLALAHAKAGHALAAAAWFEAYLIAHPDAPNVASVRQEVSRLVPAARAQLDPVIRQIFQSALQAAQTLPDEERRGALWNVSEAMAKSGYLNPAIETMRSAEMLYWPDDYEAHMPESQSGLWVRFIETLASHDVADVEQAEALLPQVTDPSVLDQAWWQIAYHYQAYRHDLPAARAAAQHIKEDVRRQNRLDDIEKEQREKDQAASVQRTTALLDGASETVTAPPPVIDAIHAVLYARDVAKETTLPSIQQALQEQSADASAGALPERIAEVVKAPAKWLLYAEARAKQLGIALDPAQHSPAPDMR